MAFVRPSIARRALVSLGLIDPWERMYSRNG